MGLAIFDLDNTLIGGDSDVLWGVFLAENKLVEPEWYQQENMRFYDQYKAGTMDIFEFLAFCLKPLSQYPVEELQQWRDKFLESKIKPIMLPKAKALLDKHRQQGDELLIITATNRFVTAPIAEMLGVRHLLATEPELTEKGYTGKVLGTPCYREGKVERLNTWLAEMGMDLRQSWFYSDSHNDLPLLEKVNHPVAVDPDDVLRETARQRSWPVISLRD